MRPLDSDEPKLSGAAIGGCELSFAPKPYVVRDLSIDIGTAGSTGLILQTLHLAAGPARSNPTRLVLTGGTFNPKAPAFPFLDITWRSYLAEFEMPLALTMVAAGFYPRGGGRIEAQIEPATPRPFVRTERGKLQRVYGTAGVANLRDDIARRMRNRTIERLEEHGLSAEIELARWPEPGQGAAISLTVEHEGAIPATFIGLGELGKPSEAVADEAVDQLLAFEAIENAAVDPHSADQILLRLFSLTVAASSRYPKSPNTSVPMPRPSCFPGSLDYYRRARGCRPAGASCHRMTIQTSQSPNERGSPTW